MTDDSRNRVSESVELIRAQCGTRQPKVALILGSGLGPFADGLSESAVLRYEDIPAFPDTTVAGHAGRLLVGDVDGVPVVCLQGRMHAYEGHTGTAMAAPIHVLKALGVESLIITNAAGSLRRDLLPGNLMVIEDHINCSFFSPLQGPNDDLIGPRFVDLSNAWDSDLRVKLLDAAKTENIELQSGVYIQYSGPNFETPAEIRMFASFGGCAIGMSTVPECLIANHCGLKVVGLSVITNLAAGIADHELSHEHTIAVANSAFGSMNVLIRRFISNL